MLDIKKLFTKILKCCYTTGTSNSWTYKKYADGTYEAWRYYQATGMALTTSSAGTYYSTSGYKDLNYPSFHSTLTFAAGKETTSHSSGVWIYNVVDNTTYLRVNYRAHASTASASCGGYFHIVGTWS